MGNLLTRWVPVLARIDGKLEQLGWQCRRCYVWYPTRKHHGCWDERTVATRGKREPKPKVVLGRPLRPWSELRNCHLNPVWPEPPPKKIKVPRPKAPKLRWLDYWFLHSGLDWKRGVE